MIAEIEHFETGWHGLFLRFDAEEIDRLVEKLQLLKERRIGHFHMRDNNSAGDKGIADIEISLKGKDERDNTIIP